MQEQLENYEGKCRIPVARILHMHVVAEYCYSHAAEYDLNSDEMYILGLLHDIGYLYGKEDHEARGAAMLERLGLPPEYVDAVLCHGMILSEIPDPSPELLLLEEADLKCGQPDDTFGYAFRLAGIEARYGKNSEAYEICRENQGWLKAHGRA